MENNPIVTIICLTFNQEQYVRDCLEGFLSQQTTFPYEVLIYDDASTDSTPAIIREYVSKYPSIFKPTFYTTNNYSQGLGFVGLYTGIKEAKGKYVAYCEGDDYWTDPHKLQKQVGFLDKNPQYVICAHETLVKNEVYPTIDGKLYSSFTNNMFVSTTKKHYTINDSFTGNIFHISSMMYRNHPFTLPSWLPSISACDMVLYMILAQVGDIYVLPGVMSIYRGHINSLTNSKNEYSSAIKFHLLSIHILRLVNRFFSRKYQETIYPIISRYYVECSMNYLRKSNRSWKKSIDMAHLAWLYNKGTGIRFIIKGLASKVSARICRH